MVAFLRSASYPCPATPIPTRWFAGATDLRERATDGKQMKLMPTSGLAMVQVGSPVQPLLLPAASPAGAAPASNKQSAVVKRAQDVTTTSVVKLGRHQPPARSCEVAFPTFCIGTSYIVFGQYFGYN